MTEKLKNVINHMGEEKNVIRFSIVCWLLGIVIVCLYCTIHNTWENIWYYPETEYQKIEKEAQRMIETGNFQPSKPYAIRNYSNNSQTHNIQMELYHLNEPNVSITLEVNSNRRMNKVITSKRAERDTVQRILEKAIYRIITIPLIFTLIVDLLILVGISLVYRAIEGTEKVKSYFQEKYAKKTV